VDEHGFDELDRRILTTIIEKFGGGPVGVASIAASMGEDRGTLENLYEPYLIQAGFLQGTPRGRIASASAYRHLGIVAQPRDGSLF
jgi:Holliday junction DNA helicase RuvB